MPTTETDQLAALVQRKLEVLTLLARLAHQQLALIEAGDMGMLMKLLNAKQALLTQLQELERQLDPFRVQDPDERRWPTPADRAQCQQQADECAQRLTEIMNLEKRAEGEMVLRRDHAAARLQGVHSAAEASHAYAASAIDPSLRSSLCDER